MKWLTEMFGTKTAREIAQRDHDDAERMYMQHKSAAEYHDALAGYYKDLALRLRETMGVVR